METKQVLRYALQQEPATGRWVIVSNRDSELVWQGQCWIGRDQRGAHLTFASSAEAEQYAAGVFLKGHSDRATGKDSQDD